VPDSLLHYTLIEKVGSGGMGEVWAAEDTKLHRKVALKTLPAKMASDPERRARFEREAQAVAALNHPNIVTIHSIEETEGRLFLTMELVQGKPLSEIIPKGGLPLKRFFEIAVPLADAVSAAHRSGITHRDLKPDNIMQTDDGRVKVLDFGLARLREDAVEAEETQLPTRLKTEAGVILGTVAYMSPEQAEGKPADARSDVFSLGVVLYQMATGTRPFRGDSPASTMSAILRDDPPAVTEANQDLPRHLGRIIRRCLAKDPLRRYQVALELRNDLEVLKGEVDSGVTLPVSALGARHTGRRSRAPWMAGAIVLVAGAAALGWLLRRAGPPAAGPDSIQGAFSKITSEGRWVNHPSLSPDGKTVAYAGRSAGNWDIYVQRVGGQNPLNLTQAESSDDLQPAFSPDGERIAFVSAREGGGIFVMGATGESVRRLTTGGCNPAWSPDGESIVYATECFETPMGRVSTSELWVADTASGATHRLFKGDAVQPSWSPNGRRVAYWGLPEGSGQRDIWTIPAGGGEPVPVTQDIHVDWDPVWSPDGRHLYFTSDRGGAMNLWRVPIDESSGKTLGPPQAVTTGVSAWSMELSLSKDGKKIVYASSDARANVQKVGFDPGKGTALGEPVWVSRTTGVNERCQIDPGGSILACYARGSVEDIYLMREDGSEKRALTNDPFKDRIPRWSPDGKEIYFYSDRSGKYEIWSIRPDGSGLTQITDTSGQSTVWPVPSPDGKRLAYSFLRESSRIVDLGRPFKEQSPVTLPPLEDGNHVGLWSWSPDGRRVAGLAIGRDGGFHGSVVYDLASGKYRWLSRRGINPVWLNDSRRVLVVAGSAIELVDAETGTSRPVLSVAPDMVENEGVSITGDNRTIFFSRIQTEADIWMLTLD